jgi:hypothetical protein
LAFAVTYELPFGKGRPLGKNMGRALDAIVGGWKTNAFVTLQSGTPLGIHMADNRLADGNQRPNVSGNPKGASIRDTVDGRGIYFNEAAFSDPGDQAVGNASRYFSNLRGDGIKNIDFSLFKDFKFTESMYVQFRAEFFNFFNTPRFGDPGTSFGSSDFGLITYQSNRPRSGQMGLRFVW